MSKPPKELYRTSKCKIHCEHHNRERREYNITASGRVWPCCFYSNAWDKQGSEAMEEKMGIFQDDILMDMLENDKDFNNLAVHDFKTIIEHPFFTKFTYYPGWDSDEQPIMCQRECRVEIDEATNTEKAKSNIDIWKDN